MTLFVYVMIKNRLIKWFLRIIFAYDNLVIISWIYYYDKKIIRFVNSNVS